MNLTQVIHRITTDADFAQQLRDDPENALAQAGYVLEQDARQALLSVLRDPARVHDLLTDLESGPDGPDWAMMNVNVSADRHATGSL